MCVLFQTVFLLCPFLSKNCGLFDEVGRCLKNAGLEPLVSGGVSFAVDEGGWLVCARKKYRVLSGRVEENILWRETRHIYVFNVEGCFPVISGLFQVKLSDGHVWRSRRTKDTCSTECTCHIEDEWAAVHCTRGGDDRYPEGTVVHLFFRVVRVSWLSGQQHVVTDHVDGACTVL